MMTKVQAEKVAELKAKGFEVVGGFGNTVFMERYGKRETVTVWVTSLGVVLVRE